MYLVDSHSHTLVSIDCKASLEAMAEGAISAGVRHFHTTDHCDLLDYDGTPVTSFPWEKAKANFHRVKEATDGRLELYLGVEMGSVTSAPGVARRILAEGGSEVDFVLGSAHNWVGVHDNREMYLFDFSDPALAQAAVATYLEQARELAWDYPDCYDSLAHLVYPLRYIRRDGGHIDLKDYPDVLHDIFTRIAATDRALELNTWQGKDLDIWLPLLKTYRSCGGRYVTVGADAHVPGDIGKGIPEAYELLKAAGFSAVTTFVRRQPVEHKL